MTVAISKKKRPTAIRFWLSASNRPRTGTIVTTIQGIWIGSSAMSVSNVVFIVSCLVMYRLGHFNARHPGQLLTWTRLLWKWMFQ
jgi:hypothetical protein